MSLREVLSIAGKLLLASLVVGLILYYLNIHPRYLLREIPEVAGDALRQGIWLVRWAVPHILLGAMIVVPVWAVVMLLRRFKR